MRTVKVILRKVNEWQNNPMLVAGIYRLFTYIPFDQIPEKHRSFFNDEARVAWDTPHVDNSLESLSQDIEVQVNALLQVIATKNVTQAMGLISMLLADMFIVNLPTAKIQRDLIKLINTFKDNLEVDRELAENYAITATVELLENILKTCRISPKFDIEKVKAEIYAKAIMSSMFKQQPANGAMKQLTPELSRQIDQALKEYDERQASEPLVEMTEDQYQEMKCGETSGIQ